MQKKNLPLLSLLLMGGALFSMHFGSSSMIWPMTWGRNSGTSIFPAFAGIFITALLMPLLGYLALARGKGSLLQLSSRVSPAFGRIFCGIVVTVTGPLFVIPRMSAASWDAFSEIFHLETSSKLPILAFSIGFYLLTYWFIASRSKTMDKVSKILFPILIAIVIGVIVKGLIRPISAPAAPTYTEPPFFWGFLQGNATAELSCALLFGMVILDTLRGKGIEQSRMQTNLIRVGIVGIGFLTLTHLGHMIVGAFTGTTFAGVDYSALYTKVVLALWGRTGGILFSFALMLAALTTAVGIAASTSNYFEEASSGKISYRTAAIVTLIISTIISTFGLDAIITWLTPVLDLCYPASIVLTLYYVFAPHWDSERGLRALRFGVWTAFAVGAWEALLVYLEMLSVDISAVKAVYEWIPLARYHLGWICLSGIAMLVGYLHPPRARRASQTVKTL